MAISSSVTDCLLALVQDNIESHYLSGVAVLLATYNKLLLVLLCTVFDFCSKASSSYFSQSIILL